MQALRHVQQVCPPVSQNRLRCVAPIHEQRGTTTIAAMKPRSMKLRGFISYCGPTWCPTPERRIPDTAYATRNGAAKAAFVARLFAVIDSTMSRFLYIAVPPAKRPIRLAQSSALFTIVGGGNGEDNCNSGRWCDENGKLSSRSVDGQRCKC